MNEPVEQSEEMRRSNKNSFLFSTLFFLGYLLQGGVVSSVEAALPVQEVLTAEENPPQADAERESYFNLRQPESWGKQSYVDRLFQRNSQKSALSSEAGPRLRLKSPGKLPGIEFGVEMHSLQAFQSVIPQENLPKGLDLKKDQPLLLPPSVNAPDYNGGFLRFTW